jgi:protein MpaA
MDNIAKSLSVILFVLFLLSCASGHHKAFPGGLEVKRDLDAAEQMLQKVVSSSESLSMDVIGTVEYDGILLPLWLISFHHAKNPRYRVLISAGIHGNEPAGVDCMFDFIESLSKNPQNFSPYNFIIIPIVNPWGWIHNIRFNKDGVDINRDFSSFNSQEAKILEQVLDGNEYDLMIDLHEDPSADGFYLYQYGRPDTAVCRRIIQKISEMGYPVEQDTTMITLKTDNGLIDVPVWGQWYMALTRQLGLPGYYRLNNCENVFTIETPTKLPLTARLTIQSTALQMLIGDLDNMK